MTSIMQYLNRHDAVTSTKKEFCKSLITTAVLFSAIVYVTKENAFETFESTKSLIFCYIMGAVWIGFCNTISLSSEESNYMIPRLKSGLISVHTYLIGNCLYQTILSLADAVVASMIFTYFDYDKKGLLFEKSNLEVFITLFLVIEAASMLGWSVGQLVHTVRSAMTVLPIVLVAQMLFSKGIFDISGFLDKISDFIEAKFGIAALGSIVNINQYPIKIKQTYPMFEIEQPLNQLFQSSGDYLTECWYHLVILTIIPVFVSYGVVNIKLRKKQ